MLTISIYTEMKLRKGNGRIRHCSNEERKELKTGKNGFEE